MTNQPKTPEDFAALLKERFPDAKPQTPDKCICRYVTTCRTCQGEKVREVASSEDNTVKSYTDECAECHRKRLDSIRSKTLLTQMPPLYREARLQDLSGEGDKAALAWLENDKRRWLLFMFSERTGTGKTYAASAILYEYCMRHAIDNLGWQSAFEIIANIQSGYKDGTASDRMNAYSSMPILLIDDLGASKATDDAKEKVFHIIERRNLACLPTIITSNKSGPELGGIYSERLPSRIASGTIAIYTGKDKRMETTK